MQKINLPILKTVEVHGVKINVRAAAYKFVRPISQEKDDELRVCKMADLVAACCTYEDGTPVDVDELAMTDITKLTDIALGGNSDFPKPPGESPSAGAV